MKKFFKWAGIVLGSLLLLLAVTLLVLGAKGRAMMNKTYEVQVETVAATAAHDVSCCPKWPMVGAVNALRKMRVK